MAEKRKVIDLDEHALLRAEERGIHYGLNYIETVERIFKTVKYGRPARRKHLSKKGITYYHYFEDNLSFYVLCWEADFPDYVKVMIKTVIIGEGRE